MNTLQPSTRHAYAPSYLRALLAAGIIGISLAGLGLTSCKEAVAPRTAAEIQTDQNLADQVKKDFSNSPSFKFPDVEVATFKGTVQLSGFVVSSDQKTAAEEIARKVSGVVEVENRISLKQ